MFKCLYNLPFSLNVDLDNKVMFGVNMLNIQLLKSFLQSSSLLFLIFTVFTIIQGLDNIHNIQCHVYYFHCLSLSAHSLLWECPTPLLNSSLLRFFLSSLLYHNFLNYTWVHIPCMILHIGGLFIRNCAAADFSYAFLSTLTWQSILASQLK